MAIKYLSSLNLNKNELQNAAIHVLSSAPSTPVIGQIYYNSGDSSLYVCTVGGATPTWAVVGTEGTATSSALGSIKLFNDTDQSAAANTVTTTENRTYGIQLNSDDQAVVNVPWQNTVYTHTTNADLTGVVTSTGNTTAIADDALSIAKTSGLQTALDGKVASNSTITGATKAIITFDSKGLVTSGRNLAAGDIPSLDAGKITSGTLDAAIIPGLDASKITTGTIDAGLLPSYVDDVLEFDDSTVFPETGATGKIYIAIDTNKTYRWSGSTYVQITSGAVDTVSGRTGAVVLTKADVDLGNVDNTSDTGKPVSTATAASITDAITTAATDATSKANSAQSAAISAAATDATNKANSAVTTAATAENSKTKVATILKESINQDGRAVTITHNFGSKNVVVQLFDAVTNMTVFADVERYSTDVVKVDFGRTPTNNVVCLLTNLAGAGTLTPTYA